MAIAAHRRVHLTSRSGAMRAAWELSDLAEQIDPAAGASLKRAITYAHSLSSHSYNNDLPDVTVTENSIAVAAAVDLLQDLFLPPDDSGIPAKS